jgi:hypothetical protein
VWTHKSKEETKVPHESQTLVATCQSWFDFGIGKVLWVLIYNLNTLQLMDHNLQTIKVQKKI